jgi:hypothetical protein
MARERTSEEKRVLNEENIRKICEDLQKRSNSDEDSEEIDAEQLNVYRLAKILFD